MIQLMSFIFLNLIAMISPGPDFAIVTKYGLSGCRKSAIAASLGVATALIIHVVYCVSGVALILSSSPKLLLILRFVGGAYLLYLGIKTLMSVGKEETVTKSQTKNAFTAGFFCNLLNPKATVFLLSLFSQFASFMNTFSMKLTYAASIPILAVVYFTALSIFITHVRFLSFFLRIKKYFVSLMGAFLVILGLVGFITSIKSYLSLC